MKQFEKTAISITMKLREDLLHTTSKPTATELKDFAEEFIYKDDNKWFDYIEKYYEGKSSEVYTSLLYTGITPSKITENFIRTTRPEEYRTIAINNFLLDDVSPSNINNQ